LSPDFVHSCCWAGSSPDARTRIRAAWATTRSGIACRRRRRLRPRPHRTPAGRRVGCQVVARARAARRRRRRPAGK